jgi:hypothetical protein
MSMRKDWPVIGKRAWYDPIRHSVEAPGWGVNAPVMVVSMRHDVLYYVTIRNAAGQEREVPHFDLDCGYSFKGRNGEWLNESHPKVREWLKKMIATESTHPDACIREKDVDLRRHWQWLLVRNETVILESGQPGRNSTA